MDDKTDKFLLMLFGIAIGAIVVYAILKRPQQQAMHNIQLEKQNLNNQHIVDIYNPNTDSTKVASDKYGLNDLENRLNDRLNGLEQRLDQKLNQNQFRDISLNQQTNRSQPVQQSMQQPVQQMENTYKNNEQWKIERGPNGRISNISVLRNAKVNTQ